MFSGVAAPSAGGRLLGRILLTGRTPRMLPDVGAVARRIHSGLPARVPSQHGDAGLTLEAPSSWATRPGPSLKKKKRTPGAKYFALEVKVSPQALLTPQLSPPSRPTELSTPEARGRASPAPGFGRSQP